MAFEYTVRQCADKLGVSQQRIYQLINDGLLPAERIAGRYFIDEYAVEARIAAAPLAGRPSKKMDEVPEPYTLMNREHEVFDFVYDAASDEFIEVVKVIDPKRAPLAIMSPQGKRASLSALTYWWKHRSIPTSRKGIDAKLRELGLSNPSRIPFNSLGLSLSDQYWIRPKGSDIDWGSVNFFNNPFSDMSMGDWLDQVGLDSPDNTSEGQLSKRWVHRNGAPILMKGGTANGQEPYNEVVATNLHERLLLPEDHVPYSLDQLPSGEVVSVCGSFLTDVEEYIPAYYVMKTRAKAGHHDAYQHYVECCSRLGVEGVERSLAKMIVTDDILGNTDRHLRNFGLIRNVETLEYRAAPIFDTGNSLLCDKPDSILDGDDVSFETKPFSQDPNQQLRLVNDYSWFDPDALEGFADDVEDILGRNAALKERIPHIRRHVEQRIARLAIIAG